ncbi:DUF4910 domain-containing protein [Polynucleobacter sp. AP-Ainpum-60-G11]|nr:DUF4910 domain-containing protein [Polynucleobacter sp. AP-Ainpum-60-G11]
MYRWAVDLFPLTRSITGEGVRETLRYFKELCNDLAIKSIPSGENVFDWVVPDEWWIEEAYIESSCGERLLDFKENNLHVVGYSQPIDAFIDYEELSHHLYSLEDNPKAIPYVTSYYSKTWGFCIEDDKRKKFEKSGKYHVVIKSGLKKGVMNYAEILIPGESKKEVFISTYICHPSMANNELSGPIVVTALAIWLQKFQKKKYSYRLIFVPETIGSIAYISKNFNHLKKNVVAGFNVTCVGDPGVYSFLPSRKGDTLSDRVAIHTLDYINSPYKKYSYLDRGSDERQYCAPGVDLPIASMMKSKYGEYREYHTSMDNLDFISAEGLMESLHMYETAIQILENDFTPMYKFICEPQMGKRGLYQNIATLGSSESSRIMMDILAYSDGKNTLLDISEILKKPFALVHENAIKLLNANLILKINNYD